MLNRNNDSAGKRLQRIIRALDPSGEGDWGVYGDYDSFDAWLAFRRSEYRLLPFDGGWLDQPKWIRSAFRTFDLVLTYHELNNLLPAPAPAPNNPFVQSK